jgi:hypothetical protein
VILDTLEEWNSCLFNYFFHEDNAGRPVWYCPDDETLGEIAQASPEAAVASLCKVVRGRLRLDHRHSIFHEIEDDASRWKVSGAADPPPFLAPLAVAVLAAVHMARDIDARPTNYYKRFRELLNLKPVSGGTPLGYGDAFPFLWSYFIWWLDVARQGRLGSSTVVGDKWRTNIGFAISQALIRRADRQRFTHFFQWIDLEPREELTGDELLSRFRVWAAGAHGISRGIQLTLENEDFAPRLAEALASEASQWDGAVRDDRGRRIGRIYLTLSLSPRVILGLVAERPEGFPESAAYLFMQKTVTVTAEAEGWYGFLPPTLFDHAMADGLRLTYEDVALEFASDFVFPLRQNRDLGCWSSVREVWPSEPHCLVVRKSQSRELVEFLREFAEPGWKPVSSRDIPAEWRVFRDVLLPTIQGYEGPFRRLVPSIRNRPVLQGGLPLPELRLFLVGGEPDIWVPAASPDVRETSVSIGDSEVPVAPESLVPLRDRNLGPGHHEVKVGPDVLRFWSIETRGQIVPDVEERLSFEFHESQPLGVAPVSGSMSDESQLICGAWIRGESQELARHPVICRVGARESVLLGAAPGQVMRSEPLEPPLWMKTAELISDRYEVYPLFPVVWVLERWEPGGWRARLRDRLEPEPVSDHAPSAEEQEWAGYMQLDVAHKLEGAESLWRLYSEAGRVLL